MIIADLTVLKLQKVVYMRFAVRPDVMTIRRLTSQSPRPNYAFRKLRNSPAHYHFNNSDNFFRDL
jgi:hypothetical protein